MSLLDFARLVRLPNVFTAWADIGMAALVTAPLLTRPGALSGVLAASTLLYWAGMIWNDYFDIEQDRRERPFRPLPSGRVRPATALQLGILFLVAGIGCAAAADWDGAALRWQSLPWALALAVCILLYDGVFKTTPLGPVLMGSCRFFNVLLGLSVAAAATTTWGLALALSVGAYIVGVTTFARTEARVSNPALLTLGAGILCAGLLLSLTVPALAQQVGADVYPSLLFPYLLAAFAVYLGLAIVPAIRIPTPPRIQAAVKRAILGLILFDAILATSLAGAIGLVLMLLLLPAYALARWVYST